MKNRKWMITLIVLLSIIFIALSIFFIGLLQNDFRLKGFRIGLQSSKEQIWNETYEEQFQNIIIDATTSEIIIKKSDTEKIKVVIYGTKENTKVRTTFDTLKIQIKEKNCIGFCWNQKVAKVEVYLPEEFNGNMELQNDYGDIEIASFLKADMKITEDCGDVTIDGANQVQVTNHYGDIQIEQANTVDIKEDYGDVIISTINDATIKNSYGDIKIQIVHNYLNLENNCGDIKVEKALLKKNSSIQDDFGDIEIGTTNQLFIDAKTDLGKVKIKKNYNQSDITLKIENNCGDIRVNH